jgi:hypothetical protein
MQLSRMCRVCGRCQGSRYYGYYKNSREKVSPDYFLTIKVTQFVKR